MSVECRLLDGHDPLPQLPLTTFFVVSTSQLLHDFFQLPSGAIACTGIEGQANAKATVARVRTIQPTAKHRAKLSEELTKVILEPPAEIEGAEEEWPSFILMSVWVRAPVAKPLTNVSSSAASPMAMLVAQV